MQKTLLPLQGETTHRIKTQGAALGYKQAAPSGRTCESRVTQRWEQSRLTLRVFQHHQLCWAGQGALAALQAVWMQIARLAAATVVGLQLHRADTGTHLTLHLAFARHMDISECLG